MSQAVALGRGKSGAEDWIADHQAFALAHAGRLRDAKRLVQRAADQAEEADQRERAAMFEIGAALWDGFFGNAASARRSAAAALKLADGRDVEYGAALTMALSGDSPGAQALAANLEKRFPEDTSVLYSYLPVLRAQLVLNRGEWAKAVELLESARYEFGSPGSVFTGNFGALYPAYVRGEAYPSAHRGASRRRV